VWHANFVKHIWILPPSLLQCVNFLSLRHLLPIRSYWSEEANGIEPRIVAEFASAATHFTHHNAWTPLQGLCHKHSMVVMCWQMDCRQHHLWHKVGITFLAGQSPTEGAKLEFKLWTIFHRYYWAQEGLWQLATNNWKKAEINISRRKPVLIPIVD